MQEDSGDLEPLVLECLADGEAEAKEGDDDDQGDDWKLHTRELQPGKNTHADGLRQRRRMKCSTGGAGYHKSCT